MAFHISYPHRGHYTVSDDAGGIVATIYYDAVNAEWSITANIRRYMLRSELPFLFGGYFHNTVKRFPDVYRFFDMPLPGLQPVAVSSATEAA